MACRIDTLCFAANDPARLAGFWGAVLGRPVRDTGRDPVVVPTDDTGFEIRFPRVGEVKTLPNQAHFDLTSTSLADQRRTVERALAHGGHHLDIGQDPAERHVVLADPEGNEFCVVEPDNRFLAGCGALGAVSCDGTQAVGYFWAQALGWPLVWDEGEETAVRSPHGGPKISWGGSPVRSAIQRNRLHLDLACDGERSAEGARLAGLGATVLEVAPDGFLLADPDGNEFRLR